MYMYTHVNAYCTACWPGDVSALSPVVLDLIAIGHMLKWLIILLCSCIVYVAIYTTAAKSTLFYASAHSVQH
jgi:hypothetical protein